jgi:hypothetical protein
MENFLELIKLGGVAVLSGIFSAFLALRRYRHEKWWEMRANAYREGIEALSDLLAHYKYELNNWQREQTTSDKAFAEIATAQSNVRKLRDMGAFMFSREAERALSEFVLFEVAEEHIVDPDDIYMPLCKKAEKCLNELVAISKKDLGISGKWL